MEKVQQLVGENPCGLGGVGTYKALDKSYVSLKYFNLIDNLELLK